MNSTIVNKKIGGSLLITIVLISSIAAITGAELLPLHFIEGRTWLGYFLITSSLLLVAYFLPETPNKEFSSRQSALGGASLFLWIAVQHFIAAESVGEENSNDSAIFIAFFVAFSFYWVALWAIRGLRIPKIQTQQNEI